LFSVSAISAALSFISFRHDGFVLEPFSSPGYFCALVGFANLLFLVFFFREIAEEVPLAAITLNLESYFPLRTAYPWKSAAVLIFINFGLFNCYAAYETLATPITMDSYHWRVLQNSLLYFPFFSLFCSFFLSCFADGSNTKVGGHLIHFCSGIFFHEPSQQIRF
jgi:hypothetical protein